MPTELSVTELRGLGLPAQRSKGGYFASLSRYDVAFSDLVIAVLTPLGTRPMRRSFGSAVHHVLFDPATLASQKALTFAIKQAVARSAPHLYVADVQAIVRGSDIALGIKFGLLDEQATQERAVLISKSDVIKLLAAAGGNQ